MSIRAVTAAVLFPLLLSSRGEAGQSLSSQERPDPVVALLQRLEQVLITSDQEGYLALLTKSANRDRAREFAASEVLQGVRHAVLQERAREPLFGALVGEGYELLVDVFTERPSRARIATWRLEVEFVSDATEPGQPDTFGIADQERMNAFDGLYKIALDPSRQYDARDLKIAAEDLQLTLAEGTMFVATTDAGVTGVVLMGRGDMVFSPPSSTEKGQVRILAGSDVLQTAFDVAYIRMHPDDFDATIASSRVTPRSVDARQFKRADEIFQTESEKSYTLDLGDLSSEEWSLMPNVGDFLAEIRTRRFDTLTYAREAYEPEDITLFDREGQRNIALYPSKQRIARFGRFYNDTDLADYDIEHYDVDLSFSPDRDWVEGLSTVRLRVKKPSLGAITMRLANSLTLDSVISKQFGRMFGLRVRNQNTVVINLPAPVPRDTVLEMTFAYAGRLPPQEAERETISLVDGQRMPSDPEELIVPSEPVYLYSNRSYFYPQGSHTDYATATVNVNVPTSYNVIATGERSADSPTSMPTAGELAPARHLYSFTANEPQRYMAVVISRFVRAGETTVDLEGGRDSMKLMIDAQPRQLEVGRRMTSEAADIARFYAGLLDDAPYPSFTIALVENDLPGGHSPSYFALVHTPKPMMRYAWRNDPVVFAAFPEFFLAHELAHQWWGQAVGWGNYHEQWLSEGFAQYFAALYAQEHHGEAAFGEVLRHLRKWSIEESDQGPVYLGYRLGHIRGDAKVFRAVVYNKGASVLHMLRRLVGDDAFFRGLRRFYAESRFKKVGTENFRKAMEAEAGQSLERFFERWIYGATLPSMKFSYTVEGTEAVLRFEQVGDLFDVPVEVTLQYADNTRANIVVPVTEQVVEKRVPLTGTLKNAALSEDDGTLIIEDK